MRGDPLVLDPWKARDVGNQTLKHQMSGDDDEDLCQRLLFRGIASGMPSVLSPTLYRTATMILTLVRP